MWHYFQGFDLDSYWTAIAMGSIHKPVTSSIMIPAFLDSITALRLLNPDKTDAEILCLMGAGGAQLLDDKDILKFIESKEQGNWGDNAGDSDFASEGFNDYYSSKGIDKMKMIKKERKLW